MPNYWLRSIQRNTQVSTPAHEVRFIPNPLPPDPVSIRNVAEPINELVRQPPHPSRGHPHAYRRRRHAHRRDAPAAWPRRPLGWVAALGTTVALCGEPLAAFPPRGTGFFGTVETSPFTVFFHVLICGIVLVALLLSLDTLPEDSHHQGEFYALIVFGAVGMCLLTSAVELLVVFIALEISSISTYILAGYRKHTGRGPEAAIKYFLLGSFATGVSALRHRADLRRYRNHADLRDRRAASRPRRITPSFVAALALMLVGILFKVSAAPFHVWTPDVYEGAPSPVVALLSTAPKAAAFALLLRVRLRDASHAALHLVAAALGRRRRSP